ncbi:MAG: hypothetical protein LBF80_04905 [Spirochaetaceae bacterium]|jgi:hypothetical protein|nr:hypothetical protein [Spirochaetaceae bacterium]
MFPAIVDAIGIQYDDEGLGLGRALDRGEPTLIELLGEEKINALLAKKSSLYRKFF